MPKWDDEDESDTNLVDIPGLPDTPAIAELRERLAQFDWRSVEHAYGTAEDTPRMLLGLLSNDENEQRRALRGLWASICHQGSVYSASPQAARFLQDVLLIAAGDEQPYEIRPYVLTLLAELARRDWYAERDRSTLRYETRKPEGEHYTRWSPAEFMREGNEFHTPQWMKATHEAVGEGVAIYLALARDDEQENQICALYLLSGFPEHAAQIIPTVEEVYAATENMFVQASVLLALGSLLGDSEEDAARWERMVALVNPTTRPLPRYAAAISLAKYHSIAANDAVTETLIEAMLTPQLLDEAYSRLPWAEGLVTSVFVEACETLGNLAAPDGQHALTLALERGASRWRYSDLTRVAEALLDTAFFGGPISGRYWTYHTGRGLGNEIEKKLASPNIQEQGEGLRAVLHAPEHDPYDQGSYFHYGHSYGKDSVIRFECFGYDQALAEAQRGRIAESGADALTSAQKQAIAAIAACDPLWAHPHNTLDIYGLPAERATLAKLGA